MSGLLGRLAPETFITAIIAASLKFHFVRIWLLSGAAPFTYLLLSGERQGLRVLRNVPLVLLLVALNLVGAAAATSWLFYWFFALACWPSMAIASLYQFDNVADFVRTRLRRLLKKLHFTADKIALFDIPALEIDVDVSGLMVIRGITISLSSLTIEAHGIEVGIKLSDDMELALQTDKVTIALFRHIQIDDVYGNVKGGQYEMTFGKLGEDTRDADGNSLMDEDSPLLRAANTWSSQDEDTWEPPEKIKMTDRMTDGSSPQPVSATLGARSMQHVRADDDDEASLRYQRSIDDIERTSEVNIARKRVNRVVVENHETAEANVDLHNEKHVRSAVCSQLHDKPSIQHPPKASVRVTTLKNLSSPAQRRFMHRLPMLLRLLLNPLTYFHPINIKSITCAASGRWLQSLLGSMVFAGHGQGNDLRNLRERIFEWLRDANFAVQLSDLVAVASVPFLTDYDITARILLDDIVAYRTLAQKINLHEVVRLGGADATIVLPTFLLPHHEHLLPNKEQQEDQRNKLRRVIKEADSMPKALQAKSDLEHTERDETFVKVSAHARLPAVFDQQLLNFAAALVKATKMIEYEKETDSAGMDTEVHGFKEFSRVLNSNIRSGIKKVSIDAAANDRWIAKMVGKVTRKMEKMQGDIGYSGKVPVSLKPYRDWAEPESKLLP